MDNIPSLNGISALLRSIKTVDTVDEAGFARAIGPITAMISPS